MLRISLFGPPVIYNNEKLITIPRRMTRALLYYLAALGKPVSRDHLVDRFWPDEPLERGRAALRDNLGKIRKDLPNKDLLQATRDMVSLDLRGVWVDLLEIEALLSRINQSAWKLPENTPLPAELHRLMVQAIQLWNAQSFLPGGDVEFSEELDDWMRATEQKVVDDMMRIAKRLAVHEATSGNLEQANRWLTIVKPFGEYDEGLHQQILENHLKGGALKDARAYYEKLQEIYGDEHEYPVNLVALSPRIYASAQNPLLPPDWNVRQSLQIPYIGQEEILADINRSYRIGGGVVIFGETGAGKTRLVQEFFRRQEGASRLMLASCQPLESSIPFSPWISLLRNSVSRQEWRALDPAWAGSLSLLLPELAEIRADRPQTFREQPDISRAALLEAVHQILLLVAKNSPVILFLDDVHWTDESTLAIVAYLLRQEFFSRGRGLLVMAARIEEQNSLLDKFLLASYPQPVRRLELRTLNSDEIAELCEHVLSHSLPFSIIERLEQDTGGNPFFLLEILSRLQEEIQPDALVSPDDLPLPSSINDLIKARLSSLRPQARELLSTAAVMGSSFELPILEKAVTLSPEIITTVMEELEYAQLVRPIPGDHPIYAFRHEKIRESLLQELSSARKRMLNQKCASAMENYLGDQRELYAAKIALHYEGGGDLLKAFHYWMAAGRNAYRLLSMYACVQSYGRAERLIPRAIGLPEEDIYKLFVAWSELAFENDDATELEHLSQTLNTLGRERSSDLLIGASYTVLSDCHMARNQFEQANEAINAGLYYITRSGNQCEYCRGLVRQGVNLYMLGHISRSQESFTEVLDLTVKSNDPDLIASRASACYQMALTETLAGFPLRGLEYAQRGLQDFDSIHAIYGKVSCYSVIGLANYLLGNHLAGREACVQGLALADRVEGWRMVGYLDAYCGMNDVEIGLLGDAWQHAQHAVELGRRYGHGEIVGLGYRVMGDLYLYLMNFKKGAQAYEQGLAAAGNHFVRLENQYRLGYCLLKQGDENGYKLLQQALETAKAGGLGAINLLAQGFELAALIDTGDVAAFEKLAAHYPEAILRRTGKDIGHYTTARLRARHLLSQGYPEKALPILNEIVPWYHESSFRWLELETLTLQAAALEKSGKDATTVRTRIVEILDFMEVNLGAAPILIQWQVFWAHYEWAL